MNLTDLKEKKTIIAELKGENKFQIIEDLAWKIMLDNEEKRAIYNNKKLI